MVLHYPTAIYIYNSCKHCPIYSNIYIFIVVDRRRIAIRLALAAWLPPTFSNLSGSWESYLIPGIRCRFASGIVSRKFSSNFIHVFERVLCYYYSQILFLWKLDFIYIYNIFDQNIIFRLKSFLIYLWLTLLQH